MMSFCKKSVHSFLLGFYNSKDRGTVDSHRHSRNISSPAGGLTFLTFSGDIHRPINVVESAAFKSPSYSPPNTSTTAAAAADDKVKRDPGGIGFIDDVGGCIDGLMSCTESLGFESSDERRVVDDKIENLNTTEVCSRKGSRGKKTNGKKEVKKFPPPLSSLNHNGKPTFYLQPVRKDGRLMLTEVSIHRPEILRATRQDGRLRLHLICHEDPDIDEEEEIEEDTEEEVEEKEEERVEGWRFPAKSGGGDGFRRCHELVVSHHHHNLTVWSQQCVTIT